MWRCFLGLALVGFVSSQAAPKPSTIKVSGTVTFPETAPKAVPENTTLEVSLAGANARFKVITRQAIDPAAFGPGATYDYSLEAPTGVREFEGFDLRAILYLHRGIDYNHPYTVWEGDWFSDFKYITGPFKAEYKVDLYMMEFVRPKGGRFYSQMWAPQRYVDAKRRK